MGLLLFKIWWMIALLPLYIFQEGSEMLSKFLKKKNIYNHWDSWHSLLVILIIIYIVLSLKGYR